MSVDIEYGTTHLHKMLLNCKLHSDPEEQATLTEENLIQEMPHHLKRCQGDGSSRAVVFLLVPISRYEVNN